MAKRVKKGVRIELPSNGIHRLRVAEERGGELVVYVPGGSMHTYPGGSMHTYAPDHCEALGMTAVLEDVPEPWERVLDALHQAARELGRTSAHPVYQLSSDVLMRAAELLGIKPEDE